MSSQIAISVEDVSKAYRLGLIGSGTLQEDVERLWARLRRRPDPLTKIGQEAHGRNAAGHFWALNRVSFDVETGGVLGIIGRNGAGKSTLLKILSQVTAPTSGQIKIRGRIASLLEVGTGFHPELTGRENVFLNGAILGMTKAEIRRKLDEIIAFSGVEEFIDTPVKRYSSGMYVRLAFAVAAHLEPEVLVVDEVLAVGDAEFQAKCLGKMSDVTKEGRTVIFVSHNMGAVVTLTRQCVWLQDGALVAVGNSRSVVETYLTRLSEASDEGRDLSFFRRPGPPDTPVRIVGFRVLSEGQVQGTNPSVSLMSDFSLEIDLDVVLPVHGANVTVVIKTAAGERVSILASWDSEFALHVEPGRHSVRVDLGPVPLAPGRYLVDIGVDPSMYARAHDVIQDLPAFSIVNSGKVIHWTDRPWGAIHWAGTWHAGPSARPTTTEPPLP